MEKVKRNGRRMAFPDVLCYSAVLSALNRARSWHLALDLLQEMRRRGEVDEICCNSAISACAASSQWPKALLLALELEETQTTSIWAS